MRGRLTDLGHHEAYGTFQQCGRLFNNPPLPRVLKTERAGLSDRPGLDTEFLISWAFLENSGLFVKNCNYHSIRENIGDSFERFTHSVF